MQTLVLVWDLPTRVFHALFGAAVLATCAIAFLGDDDSSAFPYHGMIGLTCWVMVAWRLLWGVIGSRYARFGSFLYGPGAVFKYVRHAITGGGERHVGHNPGSSYAIFAFFGLMLALAVSGYLMATGTRGIKDIHEVLAYVMLGLIGAHLLGVIMHTIRWRENIAASMLHGRKNISEDAGIRSARPIAALGLMALASATLGVLVFRYDPGTRTTSVPGLSQSLKLGDAPYREADLEEFTDEGASQDEDR